MARTIKPIALPKGVKCEITGSLVKVTGGKGSIEMTFNPMINLTDDDGAVNIASTSPEDKASDALLGTTNALLRNMVTGVSEGFSRKLELVGVGYRAQAQGKSLNLSLGFSHPVVYEMPSGVEVATPTQTEIVISGVDKQVLGQVAAEIRAFRPPEPYKGKGVRYSGERIIRKEAKKK